MTSALTIRRAEEGDADVLAALAFEAWDRDLRPYLNGAAAARDTEYNRLWQAAKDGAARTIIAEINDIPVGWCQRMAGKRYIPFLFVSPQAQNRGVGTALLRRMESIMELEGADRVQLDTLADNVRAVNFYQHQGYQILALKPEGHAGRDASTSVRLEKRLNPWHGPIDDIRNE